MKALLVAVLALIVAPTSAFLFQPPPTRLSPHRHSCGNHDVEAQAEGKSFEIDAIDSFDELRQLMLDIEGPELKEGLSLQEARDAIWGHVEESAETNIDNMCMGQLSGLMEELEGGTIPDHLNLSDARKFVRNHVNQVARSKTDSDESSGCPCCG